VRDDSRFPHPHPVKLRIASVGKDRSGLFAPGVAEYAKRLAHYCDFSTVELPEARSAGDESKKLLALKTPSDWLVTLDETGRLLSSRELADYLAKAQGASRSLLFLIGGDEGHAPAAREGADLLLSLSKMTLPHRLARLVLTEQLYRAFSMLRGEPYHK